MHGDRAIAVVEPWSLRTWLALGGAGVLLPLALTIPAAGVLDLVLVGLALTSAGGALWAIRVRTWLDRLPLEIAPVAGTGRIDGMRVYRFRARLGRGRRLQDPSAVVEFVGSDGKALPLDVQLPQGPLCGPFTVIARDTAGSFGNPGELRIRIAARAAGSEWQAERRILATDVREGRFGGISPVSGKIRFEGDWAAVG